MADPVRIDAVTPAELEAEQRLLQTQRAFDGVADDYDGSLGNNALVQRMRERLWATVRGLAPPGSRLLDLGCGTGIDAVFLAGLGYHVVACDWASRMVARTQARAAEAGLSHLVSVEMVGIHQLDLLRGQRFDAIYSDLGPLNCVSNLASVARECGALLGEGGVLVASVMGRTCPLEWTYYRLRGDHARASFRSARVPVPVGLQGGTVWTRYYSPREFFRAFSTDFAMHGYCALGVFLPPPYMLGVYERHVALWRALAWLELRLGALPLVRDLGDHFLMVVRKRRRG